MSAPPSAAQTRIRIELSSEEINHNDINEVHQWLTFYLTIKDTCEEFDKNVVLVKCSLLF